MFGPTNIKIKLGILYIQLAATGKHLYRNIQHASNCLSLSRRVCTTIA